MTSERPSGRALLVALAILCAACGNYTNEDLEFMNALPERDELAVSIPPVTGALALANEAELARTTHQTTDGLNKLVKGLLAIVDGVRSFPPTSRTGTSRIWGPFADDAHPGWQTRMIVSRDDSVDGQFDYEIAEHQVGAADTDWPVFVRGWFKGGTSARRGTGHVELLTAGVRAEGLDVSTDLMTLDHLEIDYDRLDDPITIQMHVTDLPAAGSADPGPQATYVYRTNAAGQGEMTFDLIGNFIPTTAAIEDLRMVSQWLASGAGTATLTVVAGDSAGAQQRECWNRSFAPTFNDKPWAPKEDVPRDPPGDPTLVCPVIPAL